MSPSIIILLFLKSKLSIFAWGLIFVDELHWENSFFDIWSKEKFLELKKGLLIKENFLWFKEIDLFTLKKTFSNQQNFLQFKEIFSLTVYQKNVSLIQRNRFLGVP